eukprot:3400517-Pyramimonas_sp.AAC.2
MDLLEQLPTGSNRLPIYGAQLLHSWRRQDAHMHGRPTPEGPTSRRKGQDLRGVLYATVCETIARRGANGRMRGMPLTATTGCLISNPSSNFRNECTYFISPTPAPTVSRLLQDFLVVIHGGKFAVLASSTRAEHGVHLGSWQSAHRVNRISNPFFSTQASKRTNHTPHIIWRNR